MNMGSKYHVRYTMDRWFDIPWVGGQNTIDRGARYHGLGGRYSMGMGGQNTMGKGVKIPWTGSICHG
jgi:hypothetical protein